MEKKKTYRQLKERKANKELVNAQSQYLKLSSSLRFQGFFKSQIQNIKNSPSCSDFYMPLQRWVMGWTHDEEIPVESNNNDVAIRFLDL